MRRFASFGHLVFLAAVLASVSFAASSNKKKKPSPSEQRESYEVQTKKQLDQLDKRVDELKERAGDFGPQGKARFSHRVQMLERKIETAHGRWEDLVRATAKKWFKLRHNMDETLSEIKKAYRELAHTQNP